MNLLRDGIENESVQETDQVVKLTVDGQTSSYKVYRVRLEDLYFNDQNDRIATFISKYKSENGENSLKRDDLIKYNTIIHRFIEESNKDRLRQTQDNIQLLGQQKYGIVLRDGRIIDGNRRYTCLRNLSKQSEKFSYFETVILDKDFEHSAKQIKMLELQIQIGAEERVDYDPVDRLVGIYRDIDENGLLTIEEYARSTNTKESIVKKDLEVARLIVEYLESIKAPKKYYIAREQKIDGPIRELYNALGNIKDEDKKERFKYIAFSNLLMKPDDDMTRFIRNLKNITKSVYFEEFIDKEEDIAEEILDSIPDDSEDISDDIAKCRGQKEYKEKLNRTMEVMTQKEKVKKTHDAPVKMLETAVDSLKSIDLKLLARFDEEKIDEMKNNIEVIEELVDEIKEAISNV